jgi:hypothetical protein
MVLSLYDIPTGQPTEVWISLINTPQLSPTLLMYAPAEKKGWNRRSEQESTSFLYLAAMVIVVSFFLSLFLCSLQIFQSSLDDF